MKKYITIILIGISGTCNAQIEVAGLGMDAILEIVGVASEQVQIFKNMEEELKNIKDIQSKVENVRENVDWIKTVKSASRLIMLSESVVCTAQDFYVEVHSVMSTGNSCLIGFDYNVIILKLEKTSDYINIMINDKHLTPSERLRLLEMAVEEYVQVNHNMYDMTRSIRQWKAGLDEFREYSKPEYHFSMANTVIK